MAKSRVPPSLRGNLAGERQLLLADGEIARIDDLGHDVDAVLELKGHEVGFPILDFIERRLFPSGAADVGERFVVVDRGNKERLPRGLCVERIVKPKFGRVGGTELADLFGGPRLRGANLLCGLVVSSVNFFLVGFRISRSHVAAKRYVQSRSLLRF